MAVNEILLQRVRKLLQPVEKTEGKKMFGGVAFMVDDKLCVCVNKAGIMCRINPVNQNQLLKRDGCSLMVSRNRVYQGYIKVVEEVLPTDDDLLFWVQQSLEYNKEAKASAKRKKP